MLLKNFQLLCRRWHAGRMWLNALEGRVDQTVAEFKSVYLHAGAILVLSLVVGSTISGMLPHSGPWSAPNVIFLGFVLLFGLMGMSSTVSARVWSVLGLSVGLIVWVVSVAYG